jgi:hypothetical protein
MPENYLAQNPKFRKKSDGIQKEDLSCYKKIIAIQKHHLTLDLMQFIEGKQFFDHFMSNYWAILDQYIKYQRRK